MPKRKESAGHAVTTTRQLRSRTVPPKEAQLRETADRGIAGKLVDVEDKRVLSLDSSGQVKLGSFTCQYNVVEGGVLSLSNIHTVLDTTSRRQGETAARAHTIKHRMLDLEKIECGIAVCLAEGESEHCDTAENAANLVELLALKGYHKR